jgi:NitT/TauT family transport system substrate-binding protein
VTTKSALQEKGETIRKFMAGLRDAVAAMVADENFDETIKVLRSKYSFSTLDDDNIARQSLQAARQSWLGTEGADKLLVTNEEQWTAGYQELVDAGLVPGGADAKAWFDNGFLPSA